MPHSLRKRISTGWVAVWPWTCGAVIYCKHMPSTPQRLPIELQDRDFALLRGLFESRVMTLGHIASLFFDGKPEAAKKRVQKLKSAGYVRERPRRPYEPSVLFLTRSAFVLLSDRDHLKDFPSIGITS